VAGRVIMVYKTNLLKEIPQIRALPTG
jgi:hypothetical protein